MIDEYSELTEKHNKTTKQAFVLERKNNELKEMQNQEIITLFDQNNKFKLELFRNQKKTEQLKKKLQTKSD